MVKYFKLITPRMFDEMLFLYCEIGVLFTAKNMRTLIIQDFHVSPAFGLTPPLCKTEKLKY